MKNKIKSTPHLQRHKAEGLLNKEIAGSIDDVETGHTLSLLNYTLSLLPLVQHPTHLSESETITLVQNIENKKIELETQNKELLLAKEQADIVTKKYTELYDFSPSGYFTLSKTGKIIESNLTGAKLLNIKHTQLIGRRFDFFVSNDNRTSFNNFLEKAFSSYVNETCKLTLLSNNLPLYVYLSCIVKESDNQCLVTMVDISDRKRIENALQESEQQRISILNNFSDVIWSLSWPEMNVIFISPSVEQVFGRPLQDFIQNPSLWATMVHPDDKQISDKALEQLHKEGSALRECRILRPDGSIVWINDISKIIVDKNFNPIRIDGVTRDITESKLAEIYREISREMLNLQKKTGNLKCSIQSVVDLLKQKLEFDAIGIRLQDGDDFPYLAQKGFSTDFILTENTLIGHEKDRGLCRDKNGKINLSCTCGLVISGKIDSVNPLFTPGGSIWTNNSCAFLKILPGEEQRFHPRNECIHQGYASVALVPIRNNDKNVGLIQFNDRRRGRFTSNMIESLEGMAAQLGELLRLKKIEEELQNSNELLSLFMNHSPISAFIKEVTSTESRLLKVSENFKEMAGITGSEMIGNNMFELFPAELAEKITNDDWTVVSTGKVIELEEILNDHIYTVIKYPIPYGGKTMLAGYSIDITDRKMMEKKLQESELRYRILIETAQEGILVAQGAHFKYVNPMVLKLTGNTEEELLAIPFWEIIHPDDRHLLKINYLNCLKGKNADKRYHFRIIKKDGAIRWVDLSGIKTDWEGEPAVINFITDSTDRIQVEEILKQSESRANALIDALPDMMFMLSSQGIYLNYKAAREDLGYQIQSIIGLKSRDIVPAKFADLIDEMIGITLQTGEMQVFEYQYQMPTKEIREYEARMVSSGPDKVVVIARNITYRKKAELEIRQKNEELQKLNTEKDKLFSIIAHDLLNPFQTLLGFSSAIGEELLSLPLEKIQKIAVNMRNSANKLFYLLENLLEWSQMQRGIIGFNPKSFLLADRIKEIIELVSDAADMKMIEISYDIPKGLTAVADTQMFESLMRNLVFNAIKFTHPKGKVNISAKLMHFNSVEISVSDTGIGMDQNLINHLFKLDEQINRRGTDGESSTGLGLIICKDFAERHGGKLLVKSEEGKGSQFQFTLSKLNP